MKVTDIEKNARTLPDPKRNYWPGGPDEHLGVLADGTKIKRRMLRMRACTERDAKGKLCRGHLKRYFGFPEEIHQRFGKIDEVYRCERCKSIYLPNPAEVPRTQTVEW